MALPKLAEIRIGIIGLGYVGLPLAVYLARHFPVIGFDIDRERVTELSRGIDRTGEVTEEEFARGKKHLIGSRDVWLQTNSSQALLYARIEAMGIGFEAVDLYQDRIAGVTEEDVARVAKKYFDLDHYCVGVVRGAAAEAAGATGGGAARR